MSRELFNDIFEVLEKDPDGKQFDKVSRFRCHSDLFGMGLMLDINTDIYPVKVGERLRLVLAPTINLDDTPTDGTYNAAMQSKRKTKMDEFDYVTYGKIFKYEHAGVDQNTNAAQVQIYVSFGGLLMQLTGDVDKLHELQVDSNVYLLLKKG